MAAVCYMAQSLFEGYELWSQECRRFCPAFGLFGKLNPPETIAPANRYLIAAGAQTDIR